MTKLQLTESAALSRTERTLDTWREPQWQSLWLASQKTTGTWRSLALLPAGAGATASTMLKIAVTLAQTGMSHLGTPIHVADATRVALGQLTQFTEELEYYSQQDGIVLVALSALSENVTSLCLAQSADRVLLCVLKGRMSMDDGQQTVQKVGRQRFLGSAVFRP